MGLHENRLPYLLLERLERGEQHSVVDWAKIMKRSEKKVYRALGALRKQGFMYYPVGGHSNVSAGEFEPGIVQDVMNSKNQTKEVMTRNNKTFVTPHLKSAFRLFEKALQQYPEMIDLIESEANQIVILTLNRKEELKKLNENN